MCKTLSKTVQTEQTMDTLLAAFSWFIPRVTMLGTQPLTSRCSIYALSPIARQWHMRENGGWECVCERQEGRQTCDCYIEGLRRVRTEHGACVGLAVCAPCIRCPVMG